jgi:Ca2+-binding EF-hand superfamily protein
MGWFKELFNSLDNDGSGDLDIEEIRLAVKATADGNADPDFLMKIADVDKSGTIDLTEFMFLFLIA